MWIIVNEKGVLEHESDAGEEFLFGALKNAHIFQDKFDADFICEVWNEFADYGELATVRPLPMDLQMAKMKSPALLHFA